MMILVAVVAADFSAVVALTRDEPQLPILLVTTGLFVFLYDLLLYFTLELLKKFLGPPEGGKPPFPLAMATALVLAIFVAIPVVVLIRLLMAA